MSNQMFLKSSTGFCLDIGPLLKVERNIRSFLNKKNNKALIYHILTVILKIQYLKKIV